jgi:hypothetical protein
MRRRAAAWYLSCTASFRPMPNGKQNMKLHIQTSLVAVGVTVGVTVGLASCVPPQQHPPGQAVAGPPPGDATQAPPPASPQDRRVRFNARELDGTGWAVLQQIEAATRSRIPDGDYWYDPVCGAAGAWGGPALAFLPAGLPLGGAVPAQASGGGDGRVSGVFVNGRELHPRDVQVLTQIYGVAPQPGRYWVDAAGNAGHEGGPAFVNLIQAARQRSGGGAGGGSWYQRSWGVGGDTYGGSDGQSTYFFDSASGCSVMNDGGGVMC